MRVEQLSQTARGFRGTYDCLITKQRILKELERVKWFLWHGNVFRADETLSDLMFEVDGAIEEDREARRPAPLGIEEIGTRPRSSGTISTTTHRVSSTMESGIDAGNVSQPALWNRQSISWWLSDSSRNSRCAGRRAAPICFCRSEYKHSMAIFKESLIAGIRAYVAKIRSRLPHTPTFRYSPACAPVVH